MINITEQITEKQWTEKYALDIFKEVYPEFPSGTIIHSDRPDFTVVNGNNVVGIDIMEVYQDSHLSNSSKLKQKESVKNEFEKDLIKAIEKYTQKSFVLSIEFSRCHTISNFKKGAIIQDCLAPCLEFIWNQDEGDLRIENHPDNRYNLPDEIDSIFILLVKHDTSSNSNSQGGTVSNLEYKHIEPKLLKHEGAISGYKPCHEYWLLIREGNYYAGTFSAIDIPTPIQTRFDKVFIIRTSKREYVQLK